MSGATGDTYVSAKKAAERLNCSTAMIYKLIRQGQLSGIAVGKVKQISEKSLNAYIERNRIGRQPDPQEGGDSVDPRTSHGNPRKRKRAGH